MKGFWLSCLIYVGVLLGSCPLQASFLWMTGGNQVFVGPEIYHVKRTKEGGAAQHGYLYGVRVGYERVKRYKVYWGLDGLYATGSLKGKLDGQHLKSNLTDINLEERVGYTFQAKCDWRPSLTPFIGIGYFWEKNNYKHPSDMQIHFHNRFSYIPVGFLSSVQFGPYFSMGVNFKARIILEGKNEVSNDPKFDDVTQNYEEKIHYRIELPFTYERCYWGKELGISLVPFYEYRQYGHRPNFPFDFLETKFKLYGVTLKFLYFF
ncbi:hypothetical protein [Candidatus Protochlamydia phocaeensis]|uniref:hypothetical protein n=1 Tax=Candidatus Protochlamydia phocaeensis TaxID=1414722 RepID=UPI000837E137|nr:hypothetical protein [Candidatus Protochlamydia phocaeensis]